MHRKAMDMVNYAQKGGGNEQLCVKRKWAWVAMHREEGAWPAMHRKEMGRDSYAQKGGTCTVYVKLSIKKVGMTSYAQK